jgi:hypothetical protein
MDGRKEGRKNIKGMETVKERTESRKEGWENWDRATTAWLSSSICLRVFAAICSHDFWSVCFEPFEKNIDIERERERVGWGRQNQIRV